MLAAVISGSDAAQLLGVRAIIPNPENRVARAESSYAEAYPAFLKKAAHSCGGKLSRICAPYQSWSSACYGRCHEQGNRRCIGRSLSRGDRVHKMESGVGDLPFAVQIKLQLSRLSFGQHEDTGVILPPSDFSELDTLGAPVFFGQCYFGRNNLGEFPDEKFGINCQWHGFEEERISDGILGRVFHDNRTDYSFARVYAEHQTSAQVDIFLNPDIFEKIYIAKKAVNFQFVTSFNEHKKISEELFKGKNREPDKIIIDGQPGLMSSTNKFTLDIGKKDFGQWWFRVRLVSLDFPSGDGELTSNY
mgnify:CR=1 FL=1